jgi:hypothetical protein
MFRFKAHRAVRLVSAILGAETGRGRGASRDGEILKSKPLRADRKPVPPGT